MIPVSLSNRWWMWGAIASIGSWVWSLPSLPLVVALGTGCATVIVVVLLIGHGIKLQRLQRATALYGTGDAGDEMLTAVEAENEIEALLEKSNDIEPIPPVDQLLESMEADNHRRRLEDLLRRWVDVAHRYSEAALVLRKEIHGVVHHTETAANTISSSFQAVINKATLQAREAMELLEGTQGGAAEGAPQSLTDFIRLSGVGQGEGPESILPAPLLHLFQW